MADDRIRVALSPDALAVVEAGNRLSTSSRVNAIISSYAEICGHECPALSAAEWCAVCDALNGCWLTAEDRHLPAYHIAMEVADTEGLGEKWGVDQGALVRGLASMTLAQKVAVVEVVTRFWGRTELRESNEDCLRASGARLAT